MFNSRKHIVRRTLGLAALVLGALVLTSCGGGSGTDNEKVDLPSCRDPLVLLDNGTCGEVRDPFVPPPCPEGQVRNDTGACVIPDFPAPKKTPDLDEVVIYVNIEGNDAEKFAAFATYNLHLWQDCGNGWGSSVEDGKKVTYAIPTTWPSGPGVTSQDDDKDGDGHDPYYGAYFVIPTSELGTCGNFIIKTPGGAAQTNDLQMNIKRDGGDYDRMMWVIVNTDNMRNSRVSTLPICINDVCTLKRPLLSITDVEAHWISPHTIVWNRDIAANKKVELFHATAGGIAAADDGNLTGAQLLATLSAARPLTDAERALVPHLSSYFAYDLPANISINAIKAALKDELLVVGRYDSIEENDAGATVTIERGRATRIQLAQVLDALYTAGPNDADEAKLGVRYDNGVGVSVWAPTAQNVELRIYSGDPLRVVDTKAMQVDNNTGIWNFTGTAAEFDRKFYRFRVTTYNPVAKKVQRLEVTDPYSISLSTNGRHSQFVNFNDADVKPAGWDGQTIPEVATPEEMTIYEGHIRDFSINDQSTPAAYRGKYMAFTQTNSVPVAHLQALVDAGLTHIHLLPSNDGSSISEDVNTQVNLDSYIFELCQGLSDPKSTSVCDGSVSNGVTIRSVLESYDPQTAKARELTAVLANLDGFNWNYDPQHFNAPEGSYATEPEGFTRIKEMRAMNMALHQLGLRVVMDVVYPHTTSSGIDAANSVFDKVVPGYYYRTNVATGEAENGTFAGSDTATEHRMMGKFVADSVVQWAQEYKVDGFRFDQSGYMPKSVLVDAYEAVKAVDPDNYFYAEAWTPAGGTSGDRIAERSTQEALAGTGIGTFNDRMRNPLQQLALIKGDNVDAIRAGLAGNLTEFPLKTKSGAIIKASSVGAYNLDPQEAINYVEKHDNETLWDWMHRANALPTDMTVENRVRVHSLTLSLPLLSQGVPFIQMGSDLLRSKSMSPNSYNAGDWFNNVDFTKRSNNWAVGLPPELRDGVTDDYVKTLFANPETKPEAVNIAQASAVFDEFLGIASGSPLFSLKTAQEVIDRVGFHDGGKTQVPGLIVMSIDDGVGTVAGTESTARADLDASVDAVVVVVNGTSATRSAAVKTAAGFELHHTLKNSADSQVRTAGFAVDGDSGVFTVPAYTTAVFVKPQVAAQGDGLAARVTLDQSSEAPPPYAKSVYVRGSLYDNWNAGSGNEMTYHGKGIYSLVLDLAAGSYNFKVAASDWSTPNLGLGSQAVVVGGAAALAAGGGDISISIPAEGKYRFELDASGSITAPTLKLFLDPLNGATAHVRGTVSSWDADINNQLMYEGNGIYALDLPIAAAGNYEFKVASQDWSTVDLGNSQSLLVNSELPLVKGAGNIKISFTTPATYRFEVNVQDAALPTVKVYVPEIYSGTAIYIRGSFNDWGTANQLTYQGDGTYKAAIAITAKADNYEFKVASQDWATVDRGIAAANPLVAINTPVALQVGGTGTGSVNAQVNVTTSGTYTFELNANNAAAPVLTIKPD